MSIRSHLGFTNCRERETREVCHQEFWCGEDRAQAINLSNGGMCFRLARRAEPGEVVELHHGPTLKVKARIAWCRRLEKCTEVGIAFLDSPERIESWLGFLRSAHGVGRKADTGEALLALPAPGQTCYQLLQQRSGAWAGRPVISQAKLTTGPRSGRTWHTAVRLMGQ